MLDELRNISNRELRKIARTHHIPIPDSREHLILNIYEKYCDLKMFMSYTFIRQLGRDGKDGRTFLALDRNKKQVAIKVFKKTKSSSSIVREAKLQIEASKYGISPYVIEYDGDAKYIVMEKLDINLYDEFCKQNGQLTFEQQKSIVKLFDKLDKCNIFHGDPNPLNFMRKDSKWYIIDFGMAKKITDKVRFRYTSTPNIKYMTLGFLLQLRRVFSECKLEYITKLIDKYNKK